MANPIRSITTAASQGIGEANVPTTTSSAPTEVAAS